MRNIHLYSGLVDHSTCKDILSAKGLGLEREVLRFAHSLQVGESRITVHNLLAITSGLVPMPDYNEADVTIIGGSPRGIHHEDKVEERREQELTDRLVEIGGKIIPVCYGKQLWMRARGGEIGKAKPAEWGYRKLDLRGTPLEAKYGHYIWVSSFHSDAVFALPLGYEAITDPNDSSGIQISQGREKNAVIRAFQFHPEILTTDAPALITQMEPDPSAIIIPYLPQGEKLVGPELIRDFVHA